MRRLLPLFLVLACAHAQRSGDPSAWLELQSEHFTLRTDLPKEVAQRNIAAMEQARLALWASGWHAKNDRAGRVVVVEFADRGELQEFARKDILGFAGRDRFEEPLIVIPGDSDVLDQDLFKHELTHILCQGFLVSRPRWLDEGLASYLETAELKHGGSVVELGGAAQERLNYLAYHTNWQWFAAINTGAEMLQETAETGYQMETAAWALVHYFIDTRPKQFAGYLAALASGTESWRAFTDAFPDLHARELSAEMDTYLKAHKYKRDYRTQERRVQSWAGAVATTRALPPAEVFALRADLFRASPGYGRRPELVAAEIEKALHADPGNPYALMLKKDGDAKLATSAHPDDWRSWFLAYERNHDDRAAIDRAAQLAPEEPSVLVQLTFAELRKPSEFKQAMAHATRGLELAPAREDVLDAVAHAYAANGRCEEALTLQQRSIDSRGDAGVTYIPQELLERKQKLAEYCERRRDTAAADATPQVRQTTVVADEVKVKSCKKPVPHVVFNQELQIEFTLGTDGNPQHVVVKGDAPKKVSSALQRYFESCNYEPFLVDGKPQAAEATFTVAPPSKKK